MNVRIQLEFAAPIEGLNTSSFVKTFCHGLCGINVTMASLYFIWVIYARKHPVVKVSQRN